MIRRIYRWLSSAFFNFLNDECMGSAASIAYYTIFSLPPLLVIVFYLAGLAGVSQQTINRIVKDQVGLPLTPTEEQQEEKEQQGLSINEVAAADKVLTTPLETTIGPVSKMIGVCILIFSASNTFAQLQIAFNRVWNVEPDPNQGGVWDFVLKRLLSIGMIIIMGFLLLVSLVLTTLIDELAALVLGEQPGAAGIIAGVIANNVVAILVATLLFAAMFKFLADAKTVWKDVAVGALITALLFVIGKTILGFYLQNSEVGGTWGSAAASMIGVLVWVYYTAIIVLFGAELTVSWAKEFGDGIRSANGARKVKTKKVVMTEPDEASS